MPTIWVTKEKIQTLWGLLHNIRIRMQENIKTPGAKVSGRGLSATLNIDLPNGSSNSDYQSYFKVTQTSENKIEIVDGFDDEAENCATVQVNAFSASIAKAELTITADAFIYIESTLTGGDPATGATAEIKQAASFPAYEAGKEFTLISRVTFADGKITGFTRENVPLHIFAPRTCS